MGSESGAKLSPVMREGNGGSVCDVGGVFVFGHFKLERGFGRMPDLSQRTLRL